MNKPVNLITNPTACTSVGTCEYCLSLQNITHTSSSVNMCVYMSDSCSGTNINTGCFTSTGDLVQCFAGCPNGCSGNGQCTSSGTCACNAGWTGSDCSESQLSFDQCIATGTVYGDACVHMEFDDCAVDVTLKVGFIPVYEQTITAPNFNVFFGSDQCVDIAGICQSCFYWQNFKLNSTFMSGCPGFNLSCTGLPAVVRQLGCFQDTNLVPACFGKECPRNCLDRGTCLNGVCSCNSGYTGPTCANVKCDQVSNCGGHGTCTGPQTCTCTSGWTGSDCRTKDGSNSGGSGGGNSVMIGVGVGLGLAVAGGAGAGAFVLWKRRSRNAEYARSPMFDDGLLNGDGESS